jgi:3-oxoacyl-[acyl-carrier protein] reductase
MEVLENAGKMNLGLQGRVAFVAAASNGLGWAVAEEQAREGAYVAICSSEAKNTPSRWTAG